MLRFILGITLLTNTLPASAQSWVEDILRSTRPSRISQVKTKPTQSKNTKPELLNHGKAPSNNVVSDVSMMRNVVNDPGADEKRRKTKDALIEARGYEELGQFESAYTSLVAFQNGNPEIASSIDQQKIQYAFMAKHYKEAYDEIVTRIRHLTKLADGKQLAPHHLLMLSLASALNNDVYPGQAEFCRDLVADGLANQALLNVEMDSSLAQRKDPQAIAVMSCMGLGLKYGLTSYLEFALRLDPSNVIVANELVCYYGLRNNKAAITRIASGMLKALPAGDANREKFEKDLADNK